MNAALAAKDKEVEHGDLQKQMFLPKALQKAAAQRSLEEAEFIDEDVPGAYTMMADPVWIN